MWQLTIQNWVFYVYDTDIFYSVNVIGNFTASFEASALDCQEYGLSPITIVDISYNAIDCRCYFSRYSPAKYAVISGDHHFVFNLAV